MHGFSLLPLKLSQIASVDDMDSLWYGLPSQEFSALCSNSYMLRYYLSSLLNIISVHDYLSSMLQVDPGANEIDGVKDLDQESRTRSKTLDWFVVLSGLEDDNRLSGIVENRKDIELPGNICILSFTVSSSNIIFLFVHFKDLELKTL